MTDDANININIGVKGAKEAEKGLLGVGDSAGKASNDLDKFDKSIDSVGRSTDSSAKLLSHFGTVLAGISIVGLTKNAIDLGDSIVNLQNRLKVVGFEGEAVSNTMERLFKISNDTRTSFESTTKVYARSAQAVLAAGFSYEQSIKFQEKLSQSVAISGASAEAASAGLLQFGQALGAGVLRGDELNSVIEQLPGTAQVLADKFSKGVVGGLKKVAEQGTLTAKSVVQAFIDSTKVTEQFNSMTLTVGQSYQVLQNNVLRTIGTFVESSGVTEQLAKLMLVLGNNVNNVGMAILALSSGPAIIGGLTVAFNLARASVVGLTAALLANPVGILATALISAATGLALFSEQISVTKDNAVTLGDLGSASMDSIKRAAKDAYDFLLGENKKLSKDTAKTYKEITQSGEEAYNSLVVSGENSTDSQYSSWVNWARKIANVLDGISVLIVGSFNGIIDAASNLADDVGHKFSVVGSAIKNAFTLDMEEAKKSLKDFSQETKSFGDSISEALDQAADNQVAYGLVSMIDRVIAKSKDFAEARIKIEESSKAISGADIKGLPNITPNDPSNDNRPIPIPQLKNLPTTELKQFGQTFSEVRRGVFDEVVGLESDMQRFKAAVDLVSTGAINSEQFLSYIQQTNSDLLTNTTESNDLMISEYERTAERINQLRLTGLFSDETIQQKLAENEANLQEKRLSSTQNYFSKLSALSSSGNRRIAAIGKAAALADATIQGYVAVQKALASAPYPANLLPAAIAATMSAANIAGIASQSLGGFQYGGSFTVNGQGGTDSETVAFRATPGERVTVETPYQQNVSDNASNSNSSNVRIVNVVDSSLLEEYLDTDEGEQLIMNVVRRNNG